MENASTKIVVLYSAPVVEYGDKKPTGLNEEEGDTYTLVIPGTATQQALYKSILISKPECKQSSNFEISTSHLNKIQDKLYANIFKEENNESSSVIEVNFRKWLAPVLTCRVGIGIAGFLKLYFESSYHNLLKDYLDSENQKSEEIIPELFKISKDRFSLLQILKEFFVFVNKINPDYEEKMASLVSGLEKEINVKFPPILVLMNINGCLVHRTQEKINFLKPESADERQGELWKRWVKFFKNKRTFHYLRDGYLQFLRAVMQHPRVKFAFYSSIMRKNITPVLLEIFKDDLGLYNEFMFAIFDQQFCKAAPEITDEPFGTIRDLPKVWLSNDCKEFAEKNKLTFQGFSEKNTLMLESDECNVYECFENSLIIDRYDRDDVWPIVGKEDQHRDQIAILQSIRNDLFKILDHAHGDESLYPNGIQTFLTKSLSDSSQQNPSELKLCKYLRKANQVQGKKNILEVTKELDNLKI